MLQVNNTIYPMDIHPSTSNTVLNKYYILTIGEEESYFSLCTRITVTTMKSIPLIISTINGSQTVNKFRTNDTSGYVLSRYVVYY